MLKKLMKEVVNRRYDDETWGSSAAAYRLVFSEGWKECALAHEKMIDELEAVLSKYEEHFTSATQGKFEAREAIKKIREWRSGSIG